MTKMDRASLSLILVVLGSAPELAFAVRRPAEQNPLCEAISSIPAKTTGEELVVRKNDLTASPFPHWNFFPLGQISSWRFVAPRSNILFGEELTPFPDANPSQATLGTVVELDNGKIFRLPDQSVYDQRSGSFRSMDSLSFVDLDAKRAVIGRSRGEWREYTVLSFKSKNTRETGLGSFHNPHWTYESPDLSHLLLVEKNRSPDPLHFYGWKLAQPGSLRFDFEYELPKGISLDPGSLISNSGDTIAAHVNGRERGDESLILRLPGKAQEPVGKPLTLPGSPIFLSSDGRLLFTHGGPKKYHLYSLDATGGKKELPLTGLQKLLKELWKVAIPNPGSAGLYQRAIVPHAAELSQNGRWFTLEISHEVNKPKGRTGKALVSGGRSYTTLVRWDLQNPQLDPLVIRQWDYRESNYMRHTVFENGTILVALSHEDGISLFRSDRPHDVQTLTFPEEVQGKVQYISNLQFALGGRRIGISTDLGTIIIDIAP